MPAVSAHSAMTSPTSTAIPLDADDQTPVAPAHDYGRFKQQTGLPTGSIEHLRALNADQHVFANFNSGIDEFAFGSFDGMGSQNGFGSMTGDMGMTDSMPAFFYPGNDHSQTDDFVDPTATLKQGETAQANIRYYPGMHQQAAQMRAQQMAAQRQQMLAAQQKQQREAESQQSQRRKAASPVDAHAEETIAGVVNQIRQNSMMHASMSPEGQLMPTMIKKHKDDEDMDEDERLLNSEEGKKLSSKERRQLRNKVSARAFRSRRKEYISQLEGEVALKTQEASTLRQENGALLQENDRYRGLIETLLRHPAFTPFINDISKDPATLISQAQQMAPPQQTQVHQAPTPAQPAPQPQQHAPQQEQKSDFMNFDASQPQIPSQQPAQEQQSQQVSMAMIPEENFSKLNLGNYQPSMNFNQFNTVNAYAVTDVPAPDPVNLLATSSSAHLSASSSTPIYDFDFATDMTTAATSSPRNLD